MTDGKPRSRTFEVVHRVADRVAGAIARAFREAAAAARGGVSEERLASAIGTGNASAVEAESGAAQLARAMEDPTQRALADAFNAGALSVAEVMVAEGIAVAFDVTNPNAVLYAREQTGRLIAQVSASQLESVRLILVAGQAGRLTIEEQARRIRMVVGLRPSHALAPGRLGDEIRAGQAAAATGRRLSASDKAQIRSRISRGTVTPEFVEAMEIRYARSLLNRRALDIARTESMDAAVAGQQEAWRQAIQQGVLPEDARRFAIVTPDDRLRETHALVPIMNPAGVLVDEPFDTPWGPRHRPPWETNCRCGVGLRFPNQIGVL